MSDFRDLQFYRKAFENAMAIFEFTKDFPLEERYALTTQIRKSARSVCANIAEAYRKRQFVKHFSAKISDADMENSETIVWLDFSTACGYLNKELYVEMVSRVQEVGRMLHYAIAHPEKFQ